MTNKLKEMADTLGWTELHFSVNRGDLNEVKNLIAQININEIDKFNRTALSISASQNNFEITKYLLDCGADANLGFPLHYACEKGNEKIVSLLLENQAEINLVKDGNYPLIIASRNGHLPVVEILLENGADITLRDSIQATALHNACLSGNADLVNLLINSGADPNTKDKYDNTPLSSCLIHKEKQPDLVAILLEGGAKVDILDCQDRSNLHECQDAESLRLLIKFGCDVNTCDVRNETALFAACEAENFECAKILLENGADPNVVASGGWTAFHLATGSEDLELVREFLQRGAKVNAASAQNVIPLHFAARSGNLAMVKLLLENDSLINIPIIDIPDVNTWSDHYLKAENFTTPFNLAKLKNHQNVIEFLEQQQHCKLIDWQKLDSRKIKFEDLCLEETLGWTPLHHSVFLNSFEASLELIRKGFSVNSQDNYGRTPLSIASAKNYINLIKLLLEKGADVNLGLPIQFAVKNNCMEALCELIKANCDLNIKNKTLAESTPLIEAASENHFLLVELLLKSGADPNIVNKFKQSPLHSACQFDALESAELLLRFGANPKAVDNCEDTPLNCAAANCRSEIVKLLIEHGADIHWKDNSLWTPLHRALSSEETTLELLKAGADVNYFNANVESPLFLATHNPKVARILLEYEADVNFRTSNGWSVLQEASFHGSLESVRLFLDAGADVNVGSPENILPVYLAAIRGHVEIVTELLQRGSYIDPQILDFGVLTIDSILFPASQSYEIVAGNTPLIGAASRGHLEVLKLLHARGASTSAVNCRGNSALDEAILNKHENCIEFLVSLKIDLEAKLM